MPHLRSLLITCVTLAVHSFGLSQSCQSITQILIDNGLACNTCSGVGDPYLYSGDCHIAVNRIISRTAGMEDLAFLNWPIDCYGPCHPDPGSEDFVNCVSPYDRCWGNYCPNKYYDNIKLLVDLNIQLVARAATFWGYEDQLDNEGSDQLPAIFAQLICDINASYDKNGLRRPVVQAGIFQEVDEKVKYTRISESLLTDEEVLNWIVEAGEYDSYFESDGTPLQDLKYCKSNMYTGSRLDLTRIETQIWFLEQAKFFIESGYKSLHLGIWLSYTFDDTDYKVFSRVCERMRYFASMSSSFVLLTGESPKQGPAIHNGKLILDFDGIALRPQEVVEGLSGWDVTRCDEPFDFETFDGTPCENENLLAILDTCKLNNEQGASGQGYLSPLGCIYESMPNSIYFDFGSGMFHAKDNTAECEYDIIYELLYQPHDDISGYVTQNGNVVEGAQELTYGFEDTRWFSELLSEECRDYWWNYSYCDLRNANGGFSFLRIPGMLIQKRIENFCNECDTNLPPEQNGPFADGFYMMSDEGDFVSSTIVNLEPKLPQIQLSQQCSKLMQFCSQTCNGQASGFPGVFYNKYLKGYKITTGNKDCSSTYTIHVRDLQTGGWLGQTYGPERTFYPPALGRYEIFIRQDNMALPASTFGTRTVSVVIEHDEMYCCELTFCNSPALNYLESQLPSVISEQSLHIGRITIDSIPPNITDESFRSKGGGMIEWEESNYKESNDLNINIYPNPAYNMIKLDIADTHLSGTAFVLNSSGILFKKLRLNQDELTTYEIDVSGWRDGLYIVIIEGERGEKLAAKKIVVIN